MKNKFIEMKNFLKEGKAVITKDARFVIAFDFIDAQGNSLMGDFWNCISTRVPDGVALSEHDQYMLWCKLRLICTRLTVDEYLSHLFFQIPGTTALL
jgi:hypothetical protein